MIPSGNTELRRVHPCIPETLASIYYNVSGEIHAVDPDVEFDLTQTLNLNSSTSPLVSERKEALAALLDAMKDLDMREIKEFCQIQLNSFMAETNPKTPYVGILIWYLKDMLSVGEI